MFNIFKKKESTEGAIPTREDSLLKNRLEQMKRQNPTFELAGDYEEVDLAKKGKVDTDITHNERQELDNRIERASEVGKEIAEMYVHVTEPSSTSPIRPPVRIYDSSRRFPEDLPSSDDEENEQVGFVDTDFIEDFEEESYEDTEEEIDEAALDAELEAIGDPYEVEGKVESDMTTVRVVYAATNKGYTDNVPYPVERVYIFALKKSEFNQVWLDELSTFGYYTGKDIQDTIIRINPDLCCTVEIIEGTPISI